MSIFQYKAAELYHWLTEKEDIVVIDVRNKKDFSKFKVEAPYYFKMENIPYFDFMEFEEESVKKIPPGSRVRIVCAKEGSAKYVADIVFKNGFDDVGYLEGGINTWGNLLAPCLVVDTAGYQLYQFIRPGKGSCSHGLLHANEMMIFDPSRNMDFYLDFAERKSCRIVKTFETHLQADYIAGSRIISERTGAEFLANEADFQGSKIMYTKLKDGATYTFSSGGPQVKAIFTPGHTPGSTSFIIDNKYLLSGDTVFIKSVGRPDLGGKAEEWAGMLFATLQEMQKLDSTITVLPAHFIDWDEADSNLVFACPLADTIKRNQAIYDLKTTEEFTAFIKKHMRPQPEEYARIRLINANLEQIDEAEQNTLDIGKNECAASAYAQLQDA